MRACVCVRVYPSVCLPVFPSICMSVSVSALYLYLCVFFSVPVWLSVLGHAWVWVLTHLPVEEADPEHDFSHLVELGPFVLRGEDDEGLEPDPREHALQGSRYLSLDVPVPFGSGGVGGWTGGWVGQRQSYSQPVGQLVSKSIRISSGQG